MANVHFIEKYNHSKNGISKFLEIHVNQVLLIMLFSMRWRYVYGLLYIYIHYLNQGYVTYWIVKWYLLSDWPWMSFVICNKMTWKLNLNGSSFDDVHKDVNVLKNYIYIVPVFMNVQGWQQNLDMVIVLKFINNMRIYFTAKCILVNQ